MKSTYYVILGHTCAILDVFQSPFHKTTMVISRINVPAAHRGQGYGSRLLKEVIIDADKESLTLKLDINPYGDMSYKQLHNWYLRHGFIISTDKSYVRFPR